MHIMEGYLPVTHAVGWTVVSLPFVAAGLRAIQRQVAKQPASKMILGVCGAFTFVLSALKLPSVTMSCSHPTGTGLGAMLLGPLVMAPLGTIVLLFQALLLAHGGISTLGANVFSMAVVGPFVAYGIYRLALMCRMPSTVGIFLGACLGDFMTYVVTAFQLAWAFPAQQGGFLTSLYKFLGIFAPTQVPLAISEGLLTVVIINLLIKYHPNLMALKTGKQGKDLDTLVTCSALDKGGDQ